MKTTSLRCTLAATLSFALVGGWAPGDALADCFGGNPVRVFVRATTLASTPPGGQNPTTDIETYDSLTSDPDCRTSALISATSTSGGGSAMSSASSNLAAGTVEAMSNAGPANFGSGGAQGIISDRLHFLIAGAAPGMETDITVTLNVSGSESSTGQSFTLSNITTLLVGSASVNHDANEQLNPTVTDSVNANWVSSQILDSTTTSFVFSGVYALHGSADTADFNLHLDISCGNGASCDHTATLSLGLPSGVTYTSNSGVALTPAPALAVTSINGGANPTVGAAFSVVVQAQGGVPSAPVNVSAPTAVTLSRKPGTGAGVLGGTPGCTIATGMSSCTVDGVTYSNAESAVVLTATRTSGDDVSPGDSAPFTVNPVTPAGKCRGGIVSASGALARAEAQAERACAGKIVSGKLPANTTCRTETKTAGAIGKARAKLIGAIGKACGGGDKTCGTGGDDVTLADAGWAIGSCPGIEGSACTNSITDCAAIATCLTCIDEAAVDQAISLYYDALTSTDPKNKAQKALNKCQATIGSAATSFLVAKSTALTKCWQAVNSGKATGMCPAADGKAAGAIAKAESKKIAAICKACGGADKACGGAADATPVEIGFAPTCPAVTPLGASSCGGAISTLQDIVTCVDCVTEFKVDCATQAAVPALAVYPPDCSGP